MLTLTLVSPSCAPAAGPASSPAQQAATLPLGCLDYQGQRELIAGVELEMGERAAELARCFVQRRAAVKFGDAQSSRADAAESRLQWAIPVGTIGGVAVGAGVAVGVETAVNGRPKAAQ